MTVGGLRSGRGNPVALLAALMLIVGSFTACGTSSGTRADPAVSSAPPTPSPRTSAPASGHPAPTSSTPSVDTRAKLATAIAAAGGGGTVSVAAVNLKTGARFSGGSTHGQWIASAYKLLLVESLLLKQDGDLSGSERSDAALALEHSDNAAGFRLYLDLGGKSGMLAQLRRLGVRHFRPGLFDPTLSTTSAADLVQVLRALVDPAPLGKSSRTEVLRLLRQVESDQRWGVGAAATDGDFVNKNGWLSIDDGNPAGETDNGLWAVNSMGIVVAHGQRLLMAVMTQHNDSYAAGVKRVESLARLVGRVVAP